MEPAAREELEIRRNEPSDTLWLRLTATDLWSSEWVVSRGNQHDIERSRALIAWLDGRRVGFLSYEIVRDQCQIIALAALKPRIGIGRRLLAAIEPLAISEKCQRIWLVTTNDNVPAIHFYRQCGYQLIQVHFEAMLRSRAMKYTIPLFGHEGIPIRDELEFERRLPRPAITES